MNRRTIVVAVGAGAALLLMWFFLLWGPQGGDLKDAQERRDAAEATNSQLELRVARLQDARDRAPELEADLDTLTRAVPDDPQLAQFILDANDIAIEAGVNFVSISPGVPALSAGLPPVISLSINVTGGYFEVIDYLDRLEDLPRIVVVDNLSLRPSAEESGTTSLTVAITARMFATSAPEMIPTTTTTAPASGASTTTTAASNG